MDILVYDAVGYAFRLLLCISYELLIKLGIKKGINKCRFTLNDKYVITYLRE